MLDDLLRHLSLGLSYKTMDYISVNSAVPQKRPETTEEVAEGTQSHVRIHVLLRLRTDHVHSYGETPV